MNKSESIIELAKALSKAQGEMPSAELNAVNTFFNNSRYADLGSIIKASKAILAKNGLSVSQLTTSDNGNIGLTTLLMHTSGEWLETTITLPIGDAKNVAQAAGSVITYLRRYSYASILGIYADEDTDGNDAPPARKRKAAPKITQKTEQGNGKMSLEMAEKVKNSEGVLYIEIETDKLSHMYNQIVSTIKSTPPEKSVEELQLKRDAIEVILASRK